MSNLITLVKTNLRESLDKRKFKQNKKQQAFVVYLLLMGVLFVGLSILYNVIYSMQYVSTEQIDKIHNLSVVFFVLSTFMVFTSTISKMQTIFGGKDYDMLASMPIKKRDIVLSKIFNLYVVELIVCSILLIPNSIILTIITKNLFFLLLLPLAFVAPAFPMLVALFITAVMELLIKNKKAKTIISTVFTLILLVVVMGFAFYSSFSATSENGGTQIGMFNALADSAIYINPSVKFLQMAYADNILWILAYVGSNFFLLFLVLSLVVLMYTKIHNNMTMSKTNTKHKKNKNGLDRVERTQRKEIAHLTRVQFFKSKNAVMQSGMGLVLGVIFAIAAAVALANIKLEPTEGFDIQKFLYENGFLISVGLAFFMGILPPAGTAISIEGKKFFVLKSYPMDFKGYLKEKLKFSYVVMGIPALIVSLILSIFVKQSVFSIVITILFPQLYCLALSAFTLFIDATVPYFYWKDELEVYKYHKSTIIVVFGDMGISMFTIIATVILSIFNPYLSGLFILLAFLIVSIVFYLILMKVTSKKLLYLEQEE